jgi:ferredoxin
MKIAINERCQGHARCAVFAPESFGIDDDGYAFIQEGRDTVSAEDETAVRRAANNCPEGAITVIED